MNHTTDMLLKRRGFHYSFRDFIESGSSESASPFLRPKARKLATLLELPMSITSASLWTFALLLHLTTSWIFYSSILLTLVYFFSGTRALYRAFVDLNKKMINIDVLMTMAAYLCLITDSALEGALLLVLFDISRNLERLVTSKARLSLMSLRNLAPEKAWVVEGSKTPRLSDPHTLRHIEDITPGSFIAVRAGELIPLDGIIVEGGGSLSLAHLTGEPLPINVKPGHEVPSGARIIDSPLLLRVLKPAQEATLTHIIRMVHEAQESKPKLQRFFDKFSDLYARGVIVSSFSLAIFLPFITDLPFLGFEGSIYRALAFMIAASPCAIILALPIAYLSALSACAKRGIVLKAGSVLDRLASCQQIAFDKTGTLTRGMPTVQSVERFGIHLTKLESATLTLERQAKHPLAAALVEYLSLKKLPASPSLINFELHPGYGMSAHLADGESLRVGKASWAGEILQTSWKNELLEHMQSIQSPGVSYAVACHPQGALLFQFQDPLREGVQETMQILQQNLGLKLHILTGDHTSSALKVAKQVNIKQVHADLRPQDKLVWINRLKAESGLAMVGDGINDAPALAGASVGIAMGGMGSATAGAVADALLLHDDLRLLPWLFMKARQTKRIIAQNLGLAGFVIIVASFSALTGKIPLWAAVVAHEGGTVLVGLNGLRLMYSKKSGYGSSAL